MNIYSFIHHSQKVNNPHGLQGEWLSKRWSIHTMEYYSAILITLCTKTST